MSGGEQALELAERHGLGLRLCKGGRFEILSTDVPEELIEKLDRFYLEVVELLRLRRKHGDDAEERLRHLRARCPMMFAMCPLRDGRRVMVHSVTPDGVWVRSRPGERLWMVQLEEFVDDLFTR